jgi:uncharacterized protein (DUF4415 family)
VSKLTSKGHSRAPRRVAQAIEESEIVADFLPAPEALSVALKRPVTIRLDADVVDWFKQYGSGYQTRINRVLRAYMEAKRGRG